MKSCSGRQIYLVGANRLHNELLANFVYERTGARCTIKAALSGVPPADGCAAQKRLVIYDFSDGSKSLEDLLASDTNHILKSDYLVLANLSPTMNIECEALQCGVRGFLYYEGGGDILLKMIQTVLNSELWISRELATELLLLGRLKKTPAAALPLNELTPREVAILSALTEGRSNAMIADTYFLSPHTVKTHIYHIYKKINVSSRLQAAQWASQHF